MSDPYYNQGHQNNYPHGGYNQQGQYGQQQQQYGQQQGGYGSQDFGPPRRADSFGPPQHGGFQHGQSGQQYGAYDASNPQGHPGYYGGQGYDQQQQYGQGSQYGQGQQYGQHQGQQNQGYDAFQQNQQYQQQGTGSQPIPQTAPQSSEPNAPNYDPNAPPMTESDRGLLGAVGGGLAGHWFGGKQGHGILGTLGGAIAGSFLEDKFKDKKKHSSHGSNYGGSSWGGGRY